MSEGQRKSPALCAIALTTIRKWNTPTLARRHLLVPKELNRLNLPLKVLNHNTPASPFLLFLIDGKLQRNTCASRKDRRPVEATNWASRRILPSKIWLETMWGEKRIILDTRSRLKWAKTTRSNG